MAHDALDRILDEWCEECPRLDPSPLAITGRIQRLAGLVRRHVDEALKPYGLSWELLDVLSTLRRAGPPFRSTPTALYRSCMLSSGAMTHRIDRLEAAGLVTRMPDPDDRRGILVQLTPEGQQLVDEVILASWDTQRHIVMALSSAERDKLAGLLRALLLALDHD
jgi:DNA-binding MarR family transcriptional regulator